MDNCKFCESLKEWKQVHEILEKQREPGEPETCHEFTVALVARSWEKGKRSRANRTVDYRNRGIGFALNYCPECGRRLENGE